MIQLGRRLAVLAVLPLLAAVAPPAAAAAVAPVTAEAETAPSSGRSTVAPDASASGSRARLLARGAGVTAQVQAPSAGSRLVLRLRSGGPSSA